MLVGDLPGAVAGPQISDRLVMAGLSRDEAVVMAYLFAAGPAKAGLVASVLKAGRGDVYRTLDRLVERDLVVKTDERPARYQPIPADRLLDGLLSEAQARAEKIRLVRDETLAAIAALRAGPASPTHRNLFRVLRGRDSIYAAAERMVREARSEVDFATTHPSAAQLIESAGLRALGVRKAREGVRIRALLRISPVLRTILAPSLASWGVGVRHFETDGVLRFVVVDRREIILWITSDPGDRPDAPSDVAIWTDAKDLVRSHAGLFDAAWKSGAEIAAEPPSKPIVSLR